MREQKKKQTLDNQGKNDDNDHLTHFTAAVVKVVRDVPAGKVVSYGQVAAYAGIPRGARQVGRALRQSQDTMPWWRVVNNAGVISIKDNWEHDAIEQRERLRSEGVEVKDDFTLDMEKHRFRPGKLLIGNWGLAKEYVDFIYDRFKTGY